MDRRKKKQMDSYDQYVSIFMILKMGVAAVGFEPTISTLLVLPFRPLRYAAWVGILILLPGPQVGR